MVLLYVNGSGCCAFKKTATCANFNLYNGRNTIMNRYCVDCRDHPSDVKCSLALSADTKEELLEAVVQHATTVHGYEDTPEFRNMVLSGMNEGTSC